MVITACQKGLEIALAALDIESGPSANSLAVVRFGIRIAREILDRASRFQVQSSSAWISLGNHASFRLSQKFWRFGIARPPLDWGCCANSWLITTFFWRPAFQINWFSRRWSLRISAGGGWELSGLSE